MIELSMSRITALKVWINETAFVSDCRALTSYCSGRAGKEDSLQDMAGVAGEDSGAGRSSEGISSGQRCQSGELTEWRSSEQVENGTPSTSPPYWDTDDDEDGGMVFISI